MAKKKIEEVTANETKAVEVAEVAENATEEVAVVDEFAEKKAALKTKLENLVKKWNEAFEYNEGTKEIDEDISEALGEYAEVAEKECFKNLQATENSMKAAAERLTFPVLAVQDVREDKKLVGRNVVSAEKKIDPLRLNNKAKNGVGADKKWPAMIEKLNLLLACRRAIELGLDPAKVRDTFSMSEQAAKIESLLSETDPTKYDKNAADEVLRGDLQKILDAMLGTGYSADARMVQFLLMIYQKKDNKRALSVSCANHRSMAQYCLELCHAAVTGNSYNLKYKVKK